MSEASSLPSLAVQGEAQTRESTITTLSPFINAGNEDQSPPLKLVPSPHIAQFAEPTFRGVLEECDEQRAHDNSRGGEERVPVYQMFKPTPKPASEDFAQPHERAHTPCKTPRKSRASLPTQDSRASLDTHALKSPKKSLFDRLRFSKSTTATASPPTANLETMTGHEVHEVKMPVKAKAVFGSPSKTVSARFATPGPVTDDTAQHTKTGPTRSPSKQRRGFFSSRRGTEVTIDTAETAYNRRSESTEETEYPKTASSTAATSVGGRTPQTAMSDPSHDTFKSGRRMPSQTFSDRGPRQDAVKACSIARTHSLKYMDHSQPPPTPPSKDTPPHEKAEKERLRGLGITGNETPAFHATRSAGSERVDGVVSTSGLLSPTRFGSYGQKKVTPRLVTQPSMYSLHASVVPDMLDSGAFEELKARMDGLGLEGFNNPADPETYYQPAPDTIYSPSVYNDAWDAHKSIIFKTPKTSHRRTMDDLPTLPEMPERNSVPSHRTAQSTASGITIPICYPELEKDSSTNALTPQVQGNTTQMTEVGRERRSSDETPCHGFSHSRSQSRNSALFTTPMPARAPIMHPSPSAFSHQSAIPSPLQPTTQNGLEYLKPDVYTPPPKKTPVFKDRAKRDADAANEHREWLKTAHLNEEGSATPADAHKRSASETPKRNVMDNVPILRASNSPQCNTSPLGGNPHANDAATFADPNKSATATEKQDKQDQMLQLLAQLVSRNEDLAAMREEMRAAQTRMDERLAAMEQTNRSSPSPTPSYNLLDSHSIISGPRSIHSQASTNGSQASLPLPLSESQSSTLRNHKARIATSFAHDFYRHSRVMSLPNSAVSDTVGLRSLELDHAFEGMDEEALEEEQDKVEAEGESLEDLRRRNKELTDLVQGFAKELDSMKRKMGGT
ncbi:flocculation protein FLO11-like [Teratosphaeria destructans]|uniref:Flocculation protein FLO11-like n=1 Tax=Teratosphaeria destructans TaxID=418781 RepID=A0A9W7SLZ4_9PEZI|nr:flocculation protein FLO11-like [Teratosphaeria destructans]